MMSGAGYSKVQLPYILCNMLLPSNALYILSQVADYSGLPAPPPGGHAFNPNGALPHNAPLGATATEQPPPPPPGHSGPSSLQQSFPGDTGTVIYKPDGVNPAPFVEPPTGTYITSVRTLILLHSGAAACLKKVMQ